MLARRPAFGSSTSAGLLHLLLCWRPRRLGPTPACPLLAAGLTSRATSRAATPGNTARGFAAADATANFSATSMRPTRPGRRPPAPARLGLRAVGRHGQRAGDPLLELVAAVDLDGRIQRLSPGPERPKPRPPARPMPTAPAAQPRRQRPGMELIDRDQEPSPPAGRQTSTSRGAGPIAAMPIAAVPAAPDAAIRPWSASFEVKSPIHLYWIIITYFRPR